MDEMRNFGRLFDINREVETDLSEELLVLVMIAAVDVAAEEE